MRKAFTFVVMIIATVALIEASQITSRRKTFNPGDQVPSAVLNGMQDDTVSVSGWLGDIAQLLTTAKSSAVAAINELKGRIDLGDSALAAHKAASPIDHPDHSVTAAKIATNVLGATYVADTDMTLKAVDDEVVAARGTTASLGARLDVTLNKDGTAKGGAVGAPFGMDVDGSGTTITVGPGGYALAGVQYSNTSTVSLDTTVGANFESGDAAVAATWYCLYTVSDPATHAFTLKASTTWPNSSGVHPTQATWRYRAAFFTKSNASVKAFFKVDRSVTLVELSPGSDYANIPAPGTDNCTVYRSSTNMTAFTVVADLYNFPRTATFLRMISIGKAVTHYIRKTGVNSGGTTVWDESSYSYVSTGYKMNVRASLNGSNQVTFELMQVFDSTANYGNLLALGYDDAF
jgi:hypothetical protein